jgi:hypothetical protein
VNLARALGLGGLAVVALTSCGGPNLALPSGWKTVSYQGIAIGVPASWPEYPRTFQHICSAAGPVVLVGPPVLSGNQLCTRPALPRATVVTFGGPDLTHSEGSEQTRIIHGVKALVSSTTIDLVLNSVTTQAGIQRFGCILNVRFPGRNAWLRFLEPSAQQQDACARAEQIVVTVHEG